MRAEDACGQGWTAESKAPGCTDKERKCEREEEVEAPGGCVSASTYRDVAIRFTSLILFFF